MELWNFSKDRRSEGANVIALCEAAMIPVALHTFFETIMDRDVLFFIDNTTALYGAVKGVSNEESVARAVHVAHIIAYKAKALVWYEFVESKSNFADGISRKLQECEFCKRHSIPTDPIAVPQEWWSKPLKEVYTLWQ